jgi:energy-coupling factor transporter transmembrane protein EcfT
MSIDNPRPTPGEQVVCVPVEEYLALRNEAAQLFSLMSSLLYRATPTGRQEVAENVRARAFRLWGRTEAMPAAIITMPADDDKPP